ncbi:hypothetical protein [Desulfonauticus submarinus]
MVLDKIDNKKLVTGAQIPGTSCGDKNPGKISIDVRRAITRLISNGKAFGNWERQER